MASHLWIYLTLNIIVPACDKLDPEGSTSCTDFDISGPSSDYGEAAYHHISSQWSNRSIVVGLVTLTLASLICLAYVYIGECTDFTSLL